MTRREGDFYPTPQVAIRELLFEIAPQLLAPTGVPIVFDPAAGRGALLDAANVFDPFLRCVGMEINAERVAYVRKAHQCIEGDFLAAPAPGPIDLWLSNPPYSLAQEFVTKMLDNRGPGTITAVLLRMGFLGSQKRQAWWQAHPPAALRVLSARPSFTDDGKTDNSEYAWYIFDPPARSLGLAPFGWYNAKTR